MPTKEKGGSQVHALKAAILGYAQTIENLDTLGPIVEQITSKHITFHTTAPSSTRSLLKQ